MVVSGINNYQIQTLNFGAKTRSEREAEKQKSYTRMATIMLPEADIQLLEAAKKAARERELKEQARREEEARSQTSEKQYKQDVKELKDTQKILNEITQADKDKNLLAGGTLKKIGTAADILITATLSGMALHWSTGKAFIMLNKFFKKPKVAKVINNVKRPFQIIGSSIAEGAQTAWHSMTRKVKATDSGKKFINSKPVQKINEGLDEIKTSYKNFKADAKALTTDDIKSGISTIFGVSGFGATAIEKLDKTSSKNTAKEPKDE